MIKLVIIDIDDTLVITEQASFQLENETARRLGFPPMSHETHLKNWGKALDEAIVERIPGINRNEFMKLHEGVHQEFVRHGKIDKISDKNMEFLDKVISAGLKLAIVTSRSLHELTHLLQEDHPINKRVEKLYHKDNSDYIKPDPRVFEKPLRDFKVEADEAVYIGDALGDAIAAKSAGLHFVAVLESGIRDEDYFASVNVDFFATTLPEAINYIMKVNS